MTENEGIIGWKREAAAPAADFDPYRPPAAELALLPVGEGRPLASPGSRLLARMADGVLMVASSLPGVLLMAAMAEEALAPGLLLASGVLVFLGVQIFLLVRDGQSLGKKLVGVRIVRMDGSRVSASRLFFLRFLVAQAIGAVPVLGPFASLAGILMIFRQDRRCLHDHLAGTQVVRA